MANIKNIGGNCNKCGEELQVRNVDYFAKKGIILLTILGGLVTAGFYYTVITTTRGGNIGKFLVFGTVAIFTLVYKIGNKQRDILACPHCEPSNTTEK